MLGLGGGHHRPAGWGNEGLLPNRNKNTTPFMGRGYLGQHTSFSLSLSPGNWPPFTVGLIICLPGTLFSLFACA